MGNGNQEFDPNIAAHMAIAARQAGTGVTDELREQLDAMLALGPPHDDAARYIESIVSQDDVPDVPETVPAPIQQFLGHVREAAMNPEQMGAGPEGKTLDVQTVVEAAVAVRNGNEQFLEFLDGVLEQMTSAGPPHDFVAKYIKTFSQKEDLPEIPEEIPEEIRDFLGNIQKLESANIIDLTIIVQSAIKHRETGGELPEELAKSLKQISEEGAPYDTIADFLTHVALKEELPEIAEDLPPQVKEFLTNVRNDVSS